MQVGSMCNTVRTLSYLCKKLNSALSLELIEPVLPILNYLLNNENEVLRCKIFTFYLLFYILCNLF